MTVKHRHGVAYVAASTLERDGAIAVKPMPGDDAVVVCAEERCGLVQDCLRDGGEVWLSANAVAEALDFGAQFGVDRNSVHFVKRPRNGTRDHAPIQVGQLSPNFRIATLGGGTVSLDQFGGRRVLINSWASW
jgi:hypothetical protein